jgi:outer membrane protein assembly factor BamB
MKLRRSFLSLATIVAVAMTARSSMAQQESDWPYWRGENRNGVADPNQQPPLKWSDSQNVVWKAAIPGRGHGSATVFGDQVFITAADPTSQQQLVISLERVTGKERWRTTVHEGGFEIKGKKQPNEKASLASSTVATDGKQLYINFYNDHAIWTTALDLNGEIIWQRKISDYVVHQGFGASPAIYGDLVIVSADNKGGGAIVGLERNTGEQRWRHGRPEKPNYSSPIIVDAAGRKQLILTGCDLVTSLDPLTGKTLWSIEGATTECVTSTVSDGQRIFTSGGFPKNHISAVAADGSGKIVWENNVRAYVPSMLHRDGYLFLVLDAGVATCFRSSDGEEMWKARLGGTFSSSPVLVGELIFAINEEGQAHLFKANPERFERVAENQLGESVFATPTICGSRIYLRVGQNEDGKRQEYVYCLGQ